MPLTAETMSNEEREFAYRIAEATVALHAQVDTRGLGRVFDEIVERATTPAPARELVEELTATKSAVDAIWKKVTVDDPGEWHVTITCEVRNGEAVGTLRARHGGIAREITAYTSSELIRAVDRAAAEFGVR